MKSAYAMEKCIHSLFERQVEKTPDAVAVMLDQQQISYRELNRRANRLAHHLISQGARPETLVGICMERSIEMVIALLGVLKAGGAYVPLDPAYPEERQAYMVEDSGVELIVRKQGESREEREWKGKEVRLEESIGERGAGREEEPEVEVRGENAAYVIYTSGSTGRPKGVLVHHRGLVNYLAWSGKYYGIMSQTVAPVHSPLGFDLTVTSMLTPLVAGGTIMLVDKQHPVEGLLEAIEAYPGKALVKLTPSHLEVINEHTDWNTQQQGPAVMVIGGEALRAESLGKIRENWTNTRLINEYGPTEAVVGCCVYEVTGEDERDGDVAIGRPIANTQMYALDEWMQVVPVGVEGEIYIGGDGVTRGYLGRGDLTAQGYVPDPYSEGKRLYRTGDRGRYLNDGNIVYSGRSDNQVKMRGYRIELAEIEGELRKQSGVKDAVVIVKEDVRSSKRLVAYLTTDAEQPPTASDIRDFMKTRLPDYMIPSAFGVLKSLPLTSNGKVDRQALLDIEPAGQESEAEYVAPRDQLEEKIAKIWQEVLRVERVGIQDNFFDLGGHSIALIETYSKLKELVGIEIDLVEMFRHPTIASLAEFINKGEVVEVGQSQDRAERRRERTKRQRELRKEFRTAKDAG